MAPTSRKRPKTQNPRRQSTPLLPSSVSDLLQLLVVISIASSVAISCNYLSTYFNQRPLPFCESGLDFDDSLTDTCRPCPSNGMCEEGTLECAQGYRRKGDLCVEDQDIDAAAKKFAKMVEAHLCRDYSQYLCNGIGTIWVGSNDLSTYLDAHHMTENLGLDESSYALAKLRAMETLDKLMEKRINAGRVEEFKCPDLLVKHYKPISCSVRQWVAENALVLVPVCALLIGSILMLSKARRRHYLSVRAEEVYKEACDVLEEKALMSVDGDGEPWVVASWLRDYLLLPKERRDPLLWRKVEELVQEDSRLERYQKSVKGEPRIVWEWQVEGSVSSSGKKKRPESKLNSTGLKNPTSHVRVEDARMASF